MIIFFFKITAWVKKNSKVYADFKMLTLRQNKSPEKIYRQEKCQKGLKLEKLKHFCVNCAKLFLEAFFET